MDQGGDREDFKKFVIAHGAVDAWVMSDRVSEY